MRLMIKKDLAEKIKKNETKKTRENAAPRRETPLTAHPPIRRRDRSSGGQLLVVDARGTSWQRRRAPIEVSRTARAPPTPSRRGML